MLRAFLIVLFQVLALLGYSNGWHITTRYYSLPSSSRAERVEQVYLYKGYMKMEGAELTTIFDLERSEIIYINHNNRTYWKGNPKKFVKEVRAELEASIEEKLVGVDAENQAEMRAMYMEMIESSFPSSESTPDQTRSFSVKREGSGDPIGDYNTLKYGVYEDGLYLETIWIAKELPIAQDFDFVNLSNFLAQLAQGAYGTSFESSQEYFNLLETGYPVKVEIRRGDGSLDISEVTKAERVSLSNSDFSIPKQYSYASLSAVGVWDGYL
jgi:hypothetical protein